MNENAPSTPRNSSAPDTLGPLQPHTKPRKAAKVVLSGLLAAAGITGGAGMIAGNFSCLAGVPVDQSLAANRAKAESTTKPFPGNLPRSELRTSTQPAGLEANAAPLAGDPMPVKLRPTTQSTQPVELGRSLEERTIRTAGIPIGVRLEAPSEYTVKPGDTLYSIARSQLGTDKRVKEIIKLNPGIDPDKIKPGQVINLPAK